MLKVGVDINIKTTLPTAHRVYVNVVPFGNGVQRLAGKWSFFSLSPIFHRFREIYLVGLVCGNIFVSGELNDIDMKSA